MVTTQFETSGSEWRFVPVDSPGMIRFTHGFYQESKPERPSRTIKKKTENRATQWRSDVLLTGTVDVQPIMLKGNSNSHVMDISLQHEPMELSRDDIYQTPRRVQPYIVTEFTSSSGSEPPRATGDVTELRKLPDLLGNTAPRKLELKP